MVIHLAAEVGGIGANRDHPGRFCFANLAMGMHLIEVRRANEGIKKFVQTGTVCAYPKFAPVPFKEETLWDGYPEETNAPYGVAKKALFVLLDGYKREYGLDSAVVVPVNLFGPEDNFDLHTSHVIPALIRKAYRGARFSNAGPHRLLGHGQRVARVSLRRGRGPRHPRRRGEDGRPDTPINLGTGSETTIKATRRTDRAPVPIQRGEIRWDPTKPDGQPRRCLDTSRANATCSVGGPRSISKKASAERFNGSSGRTASAKSCTVPRRDDPHPHL